MFIYNKDTQLNLIDYGIEIPLLGQRGRLVLEFIKDNFPAEKLYLDKLSNPTKEQLLFAHDQGFIERLYKDPTQDLMECFELVASDGSFHRYKPESATLEMEDLFKRISRQVSGTIKTCEFALKEGFAFHLGGGLHHAMKDRGRGFCLINDIIIAARHMQKEHNLKNIWVIDVDAHKGDGTATIAKDDPSIVTFSAHMKNGWPLDLGAGTEDWYTPSDIDVPVAPGEDYLNLLKEGLGKLKHFPKADLCIVVQGSDPYEKDELESANLLKLSSDQMLSRDKLVYDFLSSQNIPQAYVMAGGYGRWAHEPYINFLNSLL